MAPGITFDVLKRVGSPLSSARVPLLSPHRQSVPSDGPPPPPSLGSTPSASDSALRASVSTQPPEAIPHTRNETGEMISSPLQAGSASLFGLPLSPRSMTPRARQSTLDREAVEGVMAVQLKREKKKKKRQLLPVAKSSYYVVSDANKPVLEVYSSDARTEMVYLLSLAGAEMSFEADNSNIVMEKCFCVEVKTWKRKNAVYFKHQGFIFFEEDQARMLLWVKCIHSAIKKAATVDGEVFRRTANGPVSPSSPFRDYERLESDGEENSSDDSEEMTASRVPNDVPMAADDSLSSAESEKSAPGDKTRLLQSLSIDPNCRMNSPAPTSKCEADDEYDAEEKNDAEAASSHPTTPTTIYREPKTPLDRFNSMFSSQRQGFHRFPRSPAGSRTAFPSRAYAKTLPASYLHPQVNKPSKVSARIASNLQSKLAESTAGWVPIASPTSSSQRLTECTEPSSSGFLRRRNRVDGERASEASVHPLSLSARESNHYAQLSTMYAEVSHALSPTRLLGGLRKPKQASEGRSSGSTTSSATADELGNAKAKDPKTEASVPSAVDTSQQRLSERNSSLTLQRFVVLGVANIAGAYHASMFLPLAAVGLFAHLFDRDDQFAEWACISAAVYLASYCHALLGSFLIFACLFLWGYVEFQVRRRAKRNAEMSASFPDTRRRADLANIALPNWMTYPDVDRVDWLNDVFVTGWPYLKIAIRDSILNSLNPLLDAQRPAFISALSISRIELGDKTPQISGVKFVAADALTDEVTVDIAVRIVTDDSFTAELKLVSNLGAAATMSLRDLFLVGTLRLTLNPLIVEWPCFSGLTLSFTSRPVLDFSLTAARINLANVPFASEWLQSFLHDLLVNYFVWPKVVHIPLWEDDPPATASDPPHQPPHPHHPHHDDHSDSP